LTSIKRGVNLDLLLVDQFIGELNFVSRERLDPLLYLVTGQQILPSSVGYQIGQGLVFLFGLIFLSQLSSSGPGKVHRFLAAVSVFCFIIAVFGIGFFESHVQWFPWLLLAAICFVKKNSILTGFIFISTGLIWSFTAGPIAVFGLLVTLIAGLFIREDSSGWFLISSGALLLFGMAFMPVFPFPNYPGSGSLVPPSILDLRPISVVGPDPRPNMLLAEAYFDQLKTIAFCLSSIVGVVSLLAERRRIAFLIPALLLVILVLLESYLPTRGIYHSPAYYFGQLVPGFALTGVFWRPLIILAVLFLVYGCLAVRENYLVYICGISALFAIFRFSSLESLDSYVVKNRANYISSNKLDQSSTEDSPSRYIAEKVGAWTLGRGEKQRRDFKVLERVLEDKSQPWNIRVGENQSQALFLTDFKTHSWWKATGPDSSTRWLEITFPTPQPLLRAVLSLGGLKHDYPRGLEVEYVLFGGISSTLKGYHPWQGPVKWTKNGLPYFGPKSEVIVDLPPESLVQRILFTQSVVEPGQPWSISEIKLFREKLGESLSIVAPLQEDGIDGE